MKVELDESAYMPEKAHEADKEEHERRKLMQELRQKEALHRSKEPNFYWFSATSHLEHLRPENAARLIYLATFQDYDTRALMNGRKPIKSTQIADILKVSKPIAYKFLADAKEQGYITEGEDKELYLSTVFKKEKCKGNKKEYPYYKFYIETIRQLYRGTKASEHKMLGYVFAMFPYINLNYNILCTDPYEKNIDSIIPITEYDFLTNCGYNISNASRIAKRLANFSVTVYGKKYKLISFFGNGRISKSKVFVNPYVICYGYSNQIMDLLKMLFSDNMFSSDC